VIEIVKKLKRKGYLVPLLSDTIPSHDSVNRSRGVYDQFSPLFLSFQVKLSKPDPEIFKHVLRQIRYKAEECAFVDDLPLNIEGARKVGIHGIVFQGSADLIQKLESLLVSLN
jgi:putative hydrolase of the HAD superfamily